MTDREKLIKLLKRTEYQFTVTHSLMVENVADDLLQHGVTLAKDTDASGKWISVEDRLPETDGKNTFAYNVLVYVPKRDGCNQHGVYIGKLRSVKADDGSGNFWGFKTQACDWTVWGFSYLEHPVVTHWMPLPEPPKED